jgi:hypothetical protein
MQVAAVNTYVFLLSFACAFLLAGKRPVLALSTRALLVVLLALAGAYGMLPDSAYRPIVGAATLIANVLFVVFGCIDFLRYRESSR